MPLKPTRTPFVNLSIRLDLTSGERLQRLEIASERSSATIVQIALQRYEAALLRSLTDQETADYLDGLLDRATLLAAKKRGRPNGNGVSAPRGTQ